MYKKYVHIFFLLFITLIADAQEYSYIHYTERDGLSGDVVYDAAIDKKGFIWFATETGLSRFDGTRFKNFTIKDGLPANEILEIFADSKGRLWISPYMHEPVIYEEGKFIKISSTTIDKNMLRSPVYAFYEKSNGDIFFSINYQKDRRLFKYAKGELSDLSKTINNFPPHVEWTVFKDDILYLIVDDNTRFKIVGDSCYPVEVTKKDPTAAFKVDIDANGQNIYSQLRGNQTPIRSSDVNDSLLAISSKDTLMFFDKRSGAMPYHMPFKKFSKSISDFEGNIWVLSLGNGIFRYPSFEFKNIKIKNSDNVFSIASLNDSIFLGSDANILAVSGKNNLKVDKGINLNSFLKISANDASAINNRVYTLLSSPDSCLYIGTDGFLLKKSAHNSFVAKNIFPVKAIDLEGNKLLVCTGNSAVVVNKHSLDLIDTVWNGRTSAGAFYNNAYLLGTTRGLIELNQNGTFKELSTIDPAFTQGIVSIKRGFGNSMWVATSGSGILQYKNGKVIRRIASDKGLSSDICTSLFPQRNLIWVGTKKGLNEIRFDKDTFSITQYTIDDGLPSNQVNTVFAEGNIVYVGTSAGITTFDKTKIRENSQCKLQIVNVYSNDSLYKKDTAYSFAYNKNNLKIEVIAISYKSGGNITYYYKLKGLEDNWNKTTNTIINYPAIASGRYTLEIKAINKFGVESEIQRIHFFIATPWWRTTWFLILAGLSSIFIVWYLINLRYKTIISRNEERRELQKRITELEQLALRAQMNPHFIFNCLNSIQSFIINKDIETTNRYLNDFAFILRQTLDNASRQTISIADEVKYIQTYLELETMRFGEKFRYAISVDENIMSDYTLIPNMILQPFVENSIRHGIRYKDDNNGFIQVAFSQTEGGIICIVQDNGVGRKRAAAFKSNQHIEYQSKGMQLTINRLELLSVGNKDKATAEVSDIIAENGEVSGTNVKITFPFSIIDKLN